MKKMHVAVIMIIMLVLMTYLGGCSGFSSKKAVNTPQPTRSPSEAETIISTAPASEVKPGLSAQASSAPAEQSSEPSEQAENAPRNGKDYRVIGAQLVEDTVNAMIGGFTMDEVISFLGRPNQDDMENIMGTVRWHYIQGMELDFISANDEDNFLTNYIYLDSSSSVKTDRSIGIGSTRDDVMSAYKDEINPDSIKDHKIVAGEEKRGIIFIIENDKITSIYVATGRYTEEAREIPE